MGLTLGGIAAISLVIAIGLMVVGIAKQAVVYLMLIAGLGLSGLIGVALGRIMGSAVKGTATAGDAVLGAGGLGTLVLFAFLSTLLVPRLKPRSNPPTKWTKWIALSYGSVMVATGGIVSALMGLQQNVVTQAASALMSAATAIVGGF
ncbi:MAG TPA: hypothetical protein VGH54_09420 [Mycobacterium sp.]|jgi:hypothetical protein|uniref:hypothetical protein n=1 Tax=Mycobacterium sp. TaxID=1785 RepID=UPI002F409A4B